jgi:hypothetical protein
MNVHTRTAVLGMNVHTCTAVLGLGVGNKGFMNID